MKSHTFDKNICEIFIFKNICHKMVVSNRLFTVSGGGGIWGGGGDRPVAPTPLYPPQLIGKGGGRG